MKLLILMQIKMLNRLGSKRRIAQKIIQYFPAHNYFVDVFFGAGGLFFSKQKAKYNLLNDLDKDVYNFYWVVRKKKDELEKEFENTYIHRDLFNYWRKNRENDPVKQAVRFFVLSNFGYLGANGSLRNGVTGCVYANSLKTNFNQHLQIIHNIIKDCLFDNLDFRKLLTTLATRGEIQKTRTFIYCDPPYLNTSTNYSTPTFSKQDTIDLFDCLENTGCKYAISEFNNDFVIEMAKTKKLNIYEIGERQNLKNKRVEILITNYYKQVELF